MGYVIRNYGMSREIPLKSGSISMERDEAIETDDPEVVKAFSGVPAISIAEQPGTVHPVPAPVPEPEPDDDNDDEDNDDQGESENDGNDDDNEKEDESPAEKEEPDYESMLKRDLLVLAQERNLDVPDQITKVELIELLRV